MQDFSPRKGPFILRRKVSNNTSNQIRLSNNRLPSSVNRSCAQIFLKCESSPDFLCANSLLFRKHFSGCFQPSYLSLQILLLKIMLRLGYLSLTCEDLKEVLLNPLLTKASKEISCCKFLKTCYKIVFCKESFRKLTFCLSIILFFRICSV